MDRKYYIGGFNLIYKPWRKVLFRTFPEKIYKGLVYEENGRFYELLTGQYLGVCKSSGLDSFLFSDEFGETLYLNSKYAINLNLYPTSADDFANYAREYMEDKNMIIPYINMQFDKWQTLNKKRLEAKKRKQLEEAAKREQTSENVKWLNQLFNDRQ